MSTMTELLVCALCRALKPITAAAALDLAMELATDAGWNPSVFTNFTSKKAVAVFKALERANSVRRAGTLRADGSNRPLWAPTGAYAWRDDFPVPAPPTRKADSKKLDKLTPPQRYVLFEFMEEVIKLQARHRSDVEDLLQRQLTEFSGVMARARREMAAHGIDTEAL